MFLSAGIVIILCIILIIICALCLFFALQLCAMDIWEALRNLPTRHASIWWHNSQLLKLSVAMILTLSNNYYYLLLPIKWVQFIHFSELNISRRYVAASAFTVLHASKTFWFLLFTPVGVRIYTFIHYTHHGFDGSNIIIIIPNSITYRILRK